MMTVLRFIMCDSIEIENGIYNWTENRGFASIYKARAIENTNPSLARHRFCLRLQSFIQTKTRHTIAHRRNGLYFYAAGYSHHYSKKPRF